MRNPYVNPWDIIGAHPHYLYVCSFAFQAFTIKCSILWNNTYTSFTIQSDTSLEELHATVAQKMNLYPDNLTLRYRLDSNKAKMGSMLIQSDLELQIFVDRMWPMIVPPHLSNGKPSTRLLKQVIVIFDASAGANVPTEGPTHSNKVSYCSYFVCEDWW